MAGTTGLTALFMILRYRTNARTQLPQEHVDRLRSPHAEDGDRRPGIGHYPWPRAVDGLYEDVEIHAPRLVAARHF